jgi:hypothetical protein
MQAQSPPTAWFEQQTPLPCASPFAMHAPPSPAAELLLLELPLVEVLLVEVLLPASFDELLPVVPPELAWLLADPELRVEELLELLRASPCPEPALDESVAPPSTIGPSEKSPRIALHPVGKRASRTAHRGLHPRGGRRCLTGTCCPCRPRGASACHWN